MLKFNTQISLKIILVFALLNSSLYIGLHRPGGAIRFLLVLFMNISGILLLIYFVKLSIHSFNTTFYFKVLLTCLLCWSIFVIFHDVKFDIDSIITLLGNYLMCWAWLTPLAVVFGFNISNWTNLFGFFGNLLLFGSIFIFGFNYYETYHSLGLIEWMAFLPILFITFLIQNPKNKKIIILAILAYVAYTYSASQRVNFIFLLLMCFFFFIEYLRESKIGIIKKIIVLTGFIFISLFLVLKLDGIVKDVLKNKDLTTDTRTFLFVELFSDLSDKERIVGRGVMGTYFSEYFDNLIEQGIEGGDSSTRSSVEVGYLEMILKGGYIMMILYLLIMIPAAYLGIFRSKNLVARMCGYLILSYILLWTISYYPVYGAEYILLWMAVGTTISSSARNTIIEKRRPDVFLKGGNDY